MNITHEDLTRIEGKIDAVLEMLRNRGHTTKTTLQSIQSQLDRIECLLASGLAIPVNPVMTDSNLAMLTGGIPALRELNKRRAAAGRAEAAKQRRAAKLAGITTK